MRWKKRRRRRRMNKKRTGTKISAREQTYKQKEKSKRSDIVEDCTVLFKE
jgi:DNA-binding XRE family transcriptional regulator